MSNLSTMNTLSEVLNKLRERGIPEFQFTDKGFSDGSTRFYQPKELEIIKVYRFEGASDPEDMAVVYVFETKEDAYGYSINAYGTYDNQAEGYDNFLREVPEKDRDEQLLFVL
jgi:hypothetical protein